MNNSLTRVIQWGHDLLAEVLEPGDLAVDLTAGNGYDTEYLYHLVGKEGQVVAFDVQDRALEATASRCSKTGAIVRISTEQDAAPRREAGIDLIHLGHEFFSRIVPGEPKAVVANLGFLPGGSHEIITKPGTTLAALKQACDGVTRGGRLAVVVYPGHDGGAAEASAVVDFFSGLCSRTFQALQIRTMNRSQAPFLCVAEKR